MIVVAGVAGLCLVAELDRTARSSPRRGVDPDRLPYLLLGPNLAVTGSRSALLWWTSARRAGVRPSVGRFSALGAMTTVPALALAFLGLRGLRS